MNKQIELILSYQEEDKKLKNIEDEIRKSECTQKFFVAKKFLSTVNDSLNQIEQKAKSIIDEYNYVLKKLNDLKNQAKEFLQNVETVESEDELAYVKKKFTETSNLIAETESKVNSISKDMENALKDYSALGNESKKMKEQYNTFGPEYQKLCQEKDNEMKEIKSKLSELKKDIDKDLMDKYIAKRNDKKFPIVYKVHTPDKNNFYCPACATNVSLQVINDLKSGQIKECETCHKLLYFSEK